MDGGKNPDAPARTIHEVVQEGATKLRYAVGVDAGLVVAARDRMTAGEWAAMLSEEVRRCSWQKRKKYLGSICLIDPR
jgi:hypothetical protein